MNLQTKLLGLLTEEVRVIIWFEENPLSKNLPLFKTIDYLTDELLTQHLEIHPVVEQGHFIHQTFEKPFHVIYQTSKIEHLELSLLTTFELEKVVVIHPQMAHPTLIQTIENRFRWVDFWRA
jgi:hypothetical protein